MMNKYNTTSVQSSIRPYISLKPNNKIPKYMSWIVKMWHFGRDALTSYSGEKFDMRWEDSSNVFHHIYSKEYEKRMKIRDEVQEYPSKSLGEALMEKLEVV